MSLPRLLPLTSTVDLPNIKITHSGITVLHQRGSKTRYGGSAGHAVDASGKLWDNKKKMEKELYPERSGTGKKKAPAATDANNLTIQEAKFKEFFDDLPTNEQHFLTSLPDFSTYTEPKIPRTYRVKKTEVRQRILAHVSAKRSTAAELYFWTLTFPEGTTDDIIYQIFNIWLTTLRSKDKYGRRFLREYLWIAERQKNGTIHFHIAVPHFMHIKHANNVMAKILEGFARKKQIPFPPQRCKRYNGVHLAKDKFKRTTNFATKKGSRAITTYLTKYLTKNNEAFTRLAWHNSRGFANLFTCLYTTRNHFYAMGVRRKTSLGNWETVPWYQCLEEDKDKWFPKQGDKRNEAEQNEFFQFIPWGHLGPPANIFTHLADLNGYILDNFRKSKLN